MRGNGCTSEGEAGGGPQVRFSLSRAYRYGAARRAHCSTLQTQTRHITTSLEYLYLTPPGTSRKETSESSSATLRRSLIAAPFRAGLLNLFPVMDPCQNFKEPKDPFRINMCTVPIYSQHGADQ